MKLPQFPIRKSLIPYDDLGIQEVSGDNQVLGTDVGMTLAPAIGMGPTGARVLQCDKDGRLLVGNDVLGVGPNNGKVIAIQPGIVVPMQYIEHDFDTSLYHELLLYIGYYPHDPSVFDVPVTIGTYHSTDDLDNFVITSPIIHGTTRIMSFGPSGDINVVPNNLYVTLNMGGEAGTVYYYIYAHVR